MVREHGTAFKPYVFFDMVGAKNKIRPSHDTMPVIQDRLLVRAFASAYIHIDDLTPSTLKPNPKLNFNLW